MVPSDMKDSRIVFLFVALSVAVLLLTSLVIAALPLMGFAKFINFALQFHPGDLALAVLPVVAIYARNTNEPVTFGRGLRLTAFALVFLLLLSVAAESINTWGVTLALQKAGYLQTLPEHPNYIILSARSLFLTALATLLALGLIFPKRVKLMLRAKR
jgi:asparagine N-glycosylation enzyme membrane subunit Stt3